GSKLDINGAALVLGVPRVHTLEPAASLDARMVAIKLTSAPRHAHADLGRDTLDVGEFAQRYSEEIARQLGAMGIDRPFQLCGRRRVMVAGRRIVGYSVRVTGLAAAE